MILVTICVGIVSVQHQVPTTSLSLGIVTKAELAYRLLVTLLFASEQQWGVTVSGTGTFPIAFNTVYACVTIMYSPNDTGTGNFYGYIYSLSTTQVKTKKGSWESYFIAIGK